MIEVAAVSRHYGPAPALDRVSLTVGREEPVVLRGPSGSGKTTLLRLIAGLETPDSGEIRMGGAVVSRPGWALEPYQRSIGFVFQNAALWPHMRVRENVAFACRRREGGFAAAQAARWLEATEAAHLADRYPERLSAGESARVALARALVSEPVRLLLDEPLAHLDGDLKSRLLDLILNTARERAATLIYVTHDASEIERIGGRVLRIAGGRLVEERVSVKDR